MNTEVGGTAQKWAHAVVSRGRGELHWGCFPALSETFTPIYGYEALMITPKPKKHRTPDGIQGAYTLCDIAILSVCACDHAVKHWKNNHAT